MEAHARIEIMPTESIPSIQLVQQKILREPKLGYFKGLDRWQGGTKERQIYMDNATFFLYVQAYLAFHNLYPTPEHILAGVEHCSRLSFWDNCEHIYDWRVHVEHEGCEVERYFDRWEAVRRLLVSSRVDQ